MLDIFSNWISLGTYISYCYCHFDITTVHKKNKINADRRKIGHHCWDILPITVAGTLYTTEWFRLVSDNNKSISRWKTSHLLIWNNGMRNGIQLVHNIKRHIILGFGNRWNGFSLCCVLFDEIQIIIRYTSINIILLDKIMTIPFYNNVVLI